MNIQDIIKGINYRVDYTVDLLRVEEELTDVEIKTKIYLNETNELLFGLMILNLDDSESREEDIEKFHTKVIVDLLTLLMFGIDNENFIRNKILKGYKLLTETKYGTK